MSGRPTLPHRTPPAPPFPAPGLPAASTAVCVLEGTELNDGPVSGWFSFTLTDTTNGLSDLSVLYDVRGLADGPHGFHVHTWGDISSPTAAATGGHFIGTCNGCRPSGQPQEVGLLDDGVPLQSLNGRATGLFTESVAKLRGENSILSRSIVVHGNGTSAGARVGQCVIGRNFDAPAVGAQVVSPPSVPGRAQASCVMRGIESRSALPVTGPVNVTDNGEEVSLSWWVRQGLNAGPNGFHIHQFGNVYDQAAALDVGGHFFGRACSDASCRPPWVGEQSIGWLFNVGNLNSTLLSGGARGMATDTLPSLSGVDSILGRSMVLHGGSGPLRIGQCVIGLADPSLAPAKDCSTTSTDWTPCVCSPDVAQSTEAGAALPPGLELTPALAAAGIGLQRRSTLTIQYPENGGEQCAAQASARKCSCAAPPGTNAQARRALTGAFGATPPGLVQPDAVCVLQGTSDSPETLRGWMAFTTVGSGAAAEVDVWYDIQGLADGPHGFHVHTWGDISSPTAAATGGHFIGTCDDCRPSGQPQEVGLLDDGVPLQATGGRAAGYFRERVAKLAGGNSIVGRSIVVHGDGVDAGVRVGQCVIGRVSERGSVQAPPGVTKATCALRPIAGTAAPPMAAGSLGVDTEAWAGALEPAPVTGWVHLTGNTSGPGLDLQWSVDSGLFPGMNGFHVHEMGNVWDRWEGASVGGHYLGGCNATAPCRPAWAKLQEVGMLFNNGWLNGTLDSEVEVVEVGGEALLLSPPSASTPALSASGAAAPAELRRRTSAFGSAFDAVVSLQGPRSILGRALVVHAGTQAARAAFCVIGLANPAPQANATDCELGQPSPSSNCTCVGDGTGWQRSVRPVVQRPSAGGAPCSAREELTRCQCSQAAAAPLPAEAGVPTGSAIGLFFAGLGLAVIIGLIIFAVVGGYCPCCRKGSGKGQAKGGRGKRSHSRLGASDGSDIPHGARVHDEESAKGVEMTEGRGAPPPRQPSVLSPAYGASAPQSTQPTVQRSGSHVESPSNPMPRPVPAPAPAAGQREAHNPLEGGGGHLTQPSAPHSRASFAETVTGRGGPPTAPTPRRSFADAVTTPAPRHPHAALPGAGSTAPAPPAQRGVLTAPSAAASGRTNPRAATRGSQGAFRLTGGARQPPPSVRDPARSAVSTLPPPPRSPRASSVPDQRF